MHNPPPSNHVFVDFENVTRIDPTILKSKNVSFTLLLGARQTKLDVTLVEKLLVHAASLQLIRLTSSGKNALDFALVYYLGQAVAADPAGSFHIVSKDKGFDPLIEHLQTRHSRIRRYEDFATLSFCALPKASSVAPSPVSLKPSAPPPLMTAPANSDGLLALALTRLRKSSVARPKRRKTLIRYLITHLGHDLDEPGAEWLIADLSQSGSLMIDSKGAVTYRLDEQCGL
jgi:hypothetical protein